MLKMGNIQRFDSPGNYASYFRCLSSMRESNGKKKGTGNLKTGKHLSLAF
jgi:hypothetical protein